MCTTALYDPSLLFLRWLFLEGGGEGGGSFVGMKGFVRRVIESDAVRVACGTAPRIHQQSLRSCNTTCLTLGMPHIGMHNAHYPIASFAPPSFSWREARSAKRPTGYAIQSHSTGTLVRPLFLAENRGRLFSRPREVALQPQLNGRRRAGRSSSV